jgi:hypothetical protein
MQNLSLSGIVDELGYHTQNLIKNPFFGTDAENPSNLLGWNLVGASFIGGTHSSEVTFTPNGYIEQTDLSLLSHPGDLEEHIYTFTLFYINLGNTGSNITVTIRNGANAILQTLTFITTNDFYQMVSQNFLSNISVPIKIRITSATDIAIKGICLAPGEVSPTKIFPRSLIDTDLSESLLNAKDDTVLTGQPTAPDVSLLTSDDSTNIPNTAWVQDTLSAAFTVLRHDTVLTGQPTAPDVNLLISDDSTNIPNTAWVQDVISNVVSPIQLKISEYVTILDYMTPQQRASALAGDYVEDCTTAVQMAYTQGRCVDWLSSDIKLKISATITLRDNMVILGRFATVKMVTAQTPMFSGNSITGLDISDLLHIGHGSDFVDTEDAAGIGYLLVSCSLVSMRGNRFEDLTKAAIQSINSNKIWIENNIINVYVGTPASNHQSCGVLINGIFIYIFKNIFSNGAYGIRIVARGVGYDCNETHIKDNFIQSTYWAGIILECSVASIFIRQNQIYSSSYAGIKVLSLLAYPGNSGLIEIFGNSINFVDGVDGATGRRWIDIQTEVGRVITDVKIKFNSIYMVKKYGMYIDTQNGVVVISDNSIINVGPSSHDSTYPVSIFVLSASGTAIINNNHMYGDFIYGIRTANVALLTINGNIINQNNLLTAEIGILLSDTLRTMVHDNLIYACNSGISVSDGFLDIKNNEVTLTSYNKGGTFGYDIIGVHSIIDFNGNLVDMVGKPNTYGFIFQIHAPATCYARNNTAVGALGAGSAYLRITDLPLSYNFGNIW